ncbi:MAG TPA: biotin synthase BioB [Geobacteraceae bacterium]|nr:biotin synthase BioB [Geobacteraceae bacterium]
MTVSYADVAARILDGGSITWNEAIEIANIPDAETFDLLYQANRLRKHFCGEQIHLCSIINAKSGLCPEDCSFCAQSAHHRTDVQVYPLVDDEEIVRSAHTATMEGAGCFGIVTSGTTTGRGSELDRICSVIRKIRSEGEIQPACSLGIIDRETAVVLRDAGMMKYHHNLETARSFFPNICTTHDYEEDVQTVRAVKEAGLRVCCGGIFGLGETPEQRVEFAFTLKELEVDSVPINFLNPVPGTRLAHADFLTPMECLRIIALFRYVMPDKQISVCGGREKNLRDLQSWMFFAGASGTMVGNYLTTTGREPEQDLQMFRDLGLAIRKP